MKRKIFLLIIGLSLILFLFLRFGIQNIFRLYKNASIIYLVYSAIIYIIAINFRGLKWHYYLTKEKEDLSLKESLIIYHINNMISTITPLRSGEAFVPALIKKNTGISIGVGLSLVVIDRIYELSILIIMLIISMIALVSRGLFNSGIGYSLTLCIIFLCIIIFVLLFTLIFETYTISVLSQIRKHIKSKKGCYILNRIEIELATFYNSKRRYKKSFFIKQAFLTIFSWFLLYISFFYVIISITPINLLDCIYAHTISLGVGFISMVPAGLGVGAVSFTYITSLLGYNSENMVAGSIMTKFWFILLVFIVGYICLILNKRVRRDNSV